MRKEYGEEGQILARDPEDETLTVVSHPRSQRLYVECLLCHILSVPEARLCVAHINRLDGKLRYTLDFRHWGSNLSIAETTVMFTAGLRDTSREEPERSS